MNVMEEHQKSMRDRVAEIMERVTYRPPKIKMPVTFDQQTTEPYSTLCEPGLEYERNMTLDEAITFFLRYGYPPRDEGSAGVYDADGVVVIGWHWNILDQAHSWYGTRTGFDAIARSPMVDPLQLELAIAQAEQCPWA